MGKTRLPPGFRFHPTDVELVKYYLKRKILGKKLHFEAIAEVDIYKCAPWDLPDKSCLHSGDLKWYFFCPRERKYASGSRINRATKFGYWKGTGKDRHVHYNNEVVGMIRTLVFHRGRSPHGERTDWVIHEYRLDEQILALNGVVQDSYVLCILFKKDGPGPRNGSQYGAPFKEDDWTDDEEDNVNGPSFTFDMIPSNPKNSLATNEHTHGSSSVSTIINARPVTADATTEKLVPEDDDIAEMLAFFTEEECNDSQGRKDNGTPRIDPTDIYKDLGDLGNLTAFCEENSGASAGYKATTYSWDQMHPVDDEPFLELIDLDTPLGCPDELFKDGYNYYDNSDPAGHGDCI